MYPVYDFMIIIIIIIIIGCPGQVAYCCTNKYRVMSSTGMFRGSASMKPFNARRWLLLVNYIGP